MRLDVEWATSDRLAEARNRELQNSAHTRDTEIAETEAEAAERCRRALLAPSSGLKAFGDDMLNAQNLASGYAPPPSTADGCSSDYECGIGVQCLKAN
jgi:hypothetical protein